MASLDNFYSFQGRMAPVHYPSYEERMKYIQLGVNSSQASAWDIANTTPIAPVQPYNPAIPSESARPDPLLTQKASSHTNRNYVPTTPETHKIQGDTADSFLLYAGMPPTIWDGLKNWWKRTTVPVRMYSRYTPYQRR